MKKLTRIVDTVAADMYTQGLRRIFRRPTLLAARHRAMLALGDFLVMRHTRVHMDASAVVKAVGILMTERYAKETWREDWLREFHGEVLEAVREAATAAQAVDRGSLLTWSDGIVERVEALGRHFWQRVFLARKVSRLVEAEAAGIASKINQPRVSLRLALRSAIGSLVASRLARAPRRQKWLDAFRADFDKIVEANVTA